MHQGLRRSAIHSESGWGVVVCNPWQIPRHSRQTPPEDAVAVWRADLRRYPDAGYPMVSPRNFILRICFGVPSTIIRYLFGTCPLFVRYLSSQRLNIYWTSTAHILGNNARKSLTTLWGQRSYSWLSPKSWLNSISILRAYYIEYTEKTRPFRPL